MIRKSFAYANACFLSFKQLWSIKTFLRLNIFRGGVALKTISVQNNVERRKYVHDRAAYWSWTGNLRATPLLSSSVKIDCRDVTIWGPYEYLLWVFFWYSTLTISLYVRWDCKPMWKRRCVRSIEVEPIFVYLSDEVYWKEMLRYIS